MIFQLFKKLGDRWFPERCGRWGVFKSLILLPLYVYNAQAVQYFFRAACNSVGPVHWSNFGLVIAHIAQP